jgi:DNA-binding XRE family transcriptional regulator
MKNRLRVLRAERDWSQADLAERLEVSRQSVHAIEKGKFDLSLPPGIPFGSAVRDANRANLCRRRFQITVRVERRQTWELGQFSA